MQNETEDRTGVLNPTPALVLQIYTCRWIAEAVTRCIVSWWIQSWYQTEWCHFFSDAFKTLLV